MRKKKVEELINQIVDKKLNEKSREINNQLREIYSQLIALKECHSFKRNYVEDIFNGKNSYFCSHKPEIVKTDNAGEITFDQLAKLVIDGVPIKVKKEVESNVYCNGCIENVSYNKNK